MTAKEQPAEAPLAPAWHTAALTVLICGVAAFGVLLGAPPAIATGASRSASFYAPTIVVELLLLLYVVRIGRQRFVFRELVGVTERDRGRFAMDVALAVAGVCIVHIVELIWSSCGGTAANPSVASILPKTSAERVGWTVLSLTVGISEEIVYRGYLQRQWAAFLGSRAAGIVVSAALFGIAHVNQGASAAVRIALYGLGFGLLAQWRRSLIPGILCHSALDALSGLAPHG